MTAKAIGLRLRFGLNFRGYFSENLYNELLEDNKSRIEQITGLSEGISTDLTGHKSKIEKLFGEVSGKATTGNFTEAANQFDVELVPALALAEEAAKNFREAKEKFDRDYGAIRGKIQPIVDTWGDDIPKDLKDKRTEIHDANELVAAEEKVFNYVKAVSLLETQGLVAKVNQAESAKKTWDEAKVKYEKDYGDIKDKITAVAGTWGDDISQELKDKRKTVVDLNQQVTDQAGALAFRQAVDLMTRQDLAGKVNSAESAKQTWDNAKGKYEKDYGDIKDKIAAVLTTWGDDISADLKNLRTALDGSNKKVEDEAKIFEFPKAVQLMGSEKLGDKLTAAEGLKLQFDTDKAQHELDSPKAEDWVSKLCKHSNWKDVDPKIDALIEQRNKGRASAKKWNYGAALPRWTKIITDAPKVSAEADQWQKFRPAETTAQGLIAEVKDHYKKSVAQAKYADMKAALLEAQDKASKQKFDEAHVKLGEITTLYGEAMTLASTAFLAEMATAKLDKLELHPRAPVIAGDIGNLRKIAADAETNLKNGLHKAAVKMIWDVYNNYKSLKKIADASATYETAKTKAEEQVKELKDLKQPVIAEGVAGLEGKLAAALKEGADNVRKYGDAQVLFDEIATAHAELKKLAGEHAAVASEKEAVLKQDPDQATAALRAKHKTLSEKGEEIVKEIKTPLDTAKGKLDEADRLIGEEKKKTGEKK